MNKSPSNDIATNEDIAGQAAHWVEKMDEGKLSPDSNRQFIYWLKKSPLHVNEFIQACVVFDATELVEQYKDIAAEVSWTSKAHIRQYPHSGTVSVNRARHTRKTSKWFFALAVSTLLFLAGSTYLFLPDLLSKPDKNVPLTKSYTTGLGELRSVLLADGTLVNMNTLTVIEERFSEEFRDVVLLSGEAIFKVAHQPEKPLRVWSENIIAQATGSEFNVKRSDATATIADTSPASTKTIITVISGNVAVSAKPKIAADGVMGEALVRQGTTNTVNLTKGEEVLFNQQGIVLKRQNTNLTKRLSWTQKRLIFSGESLQEVVSEFNRYSKTQIEITDKKAAGLSVSGVFTTNNPNTLIEFLHSTGELVVSEAQRNRVVVSSIER